MEFDFLHPGKHPPETHFLTKNPTSQVNFPSSCTMVHYPSYTAESLPLFHKKTEGFSKRKSTIYTYSEL